MPGYQFRRPCLKCGTPTYGSYCPEHKLPPKARPDTPQRKAKKAALYNSAYSKQAKFIRQTAIICHLCGEGARPGDPWQADHIDPGNPYSELKPAHRSCNARRGNKPLQQPR